MRDEFMKFMKKYKHAWVIPVYGILYLLASNYLVLLIAVFSSTGLIERAAKVIYKHAPRLYWFGTAVLTAALLIVTTAFLV